MSIWENKKQVKEIMFDDNKSFLQQLNLCFFDIPNINDQSEKSNDFFDALSETDSMDLFDSLSINIILEKAWSEHRTSFVCFFTLPYCVLVSAYFIWSNFVMVEFTDSIFASVQT